VEEGGKWGERWGKHDRVSKAIRQVTSPVLEDVEVALLVLVPVLVLDPVLVDDDDSVVRQQQESEEKKNTGEAWTHPTQGATGKVPMRAPVDSEGHTHTHAGCPPELVDVDVPVLLAVIVLALVPELVLDGDDVDVAVAVDVPATPQTPRRKSNS
jgi:hypothetical protein